MFSFAPLNLDANEFAGWAIKFPLSIQLNLSLPIGLSKMKNSKKKKKKAKKKESGGVFKKTKKKNKKKEWNDCFSVWKRE